MPPSQIPGKFSNPAQSNNASSSIADKAPSKATDSFNTSKYPKIEKLKNDGNDAFKKGKHEEASSFYFEVFFFISPKNPFLFLLGNTRN